MIKNSKKIILSLVATLALSGSAIANQEKVYAVVNGEKITNQEIAMVLRDQRVTFDSLDKTQQKQIIDGLIEQSLLTAEAYKSDIINSKEYKEELEKVKKTLAFQFWIRDFSKNIDIKDSEVKKYYDSNKAKFKSTDQLKASHILVKTQKEADDIINELSKASNLKKAFTKAAQEKSVGPSGPSGGELGWFTKEKMVPEFSAAAAKLEVGKITKKAVKTQFGFHIIYLDDMKKAGVVAYEQIKERLKQELLQQKFTKSVKDKANKLKEKAKIQYK